VCLVAMRKTCCGDRDNRPSERFSLTPTNYLVLVFGDVGVNSLKPSAIQSNRCFEFVSCDVVKR
jgi:hypothetical protein